MSRAAHKITAANFRLVLCTGGVALLVAGCAGGGARGGPSAGIATNSAAPVQLGASSASGAAIRQSVLGPLDDAKIARAIENYRISKKRAKGPYKIAGADLNGDGVREAIVLFQGKDWCARTGCSLAIFQLFERGFKPISRTVRVKPPVEIADAVTNMYRDLLVQTGGGPAPERRVRLQFSGESYSRNAMLQSEVPLGSLVRTEIAIDVAASPSDATASAPQPVSAPKR
ncbi:MAG TPA: hypothetical protein ENH05_09040 [Rhizobiales bacterium]|nr:hypothetical protein BMS3Bbin10_02723 [bacterium BMS3Bbin10]HDO52866.1 hypothetical protein [Hyphomicrobiales bacterium]